MDTPGVSVKNRYFSPSRPLLASPGNQNRYFLKGILMKIDTFVHPRRLTLMQMRLRNLYIYTSPKTGVAGLMDWWGPFAGNFCLLPLNTAAPLPLSTLIPARMEPYMFPHAELLSLVTSGVGEVPQPLGDPCLSFPSPPLLM